MNPSNHAGLQQNIIELVKSTIRTSIGKGNSELDSPKIIDNFKENPELYSELLTVSIILSLDRHYEQKYTNRKIYYRYQKQYPS